MKINGVEHDEAAIVSFLTKGQGIEIVSGFVEGINQKMGRLGEEIHNQVLPSLGDIPAQSGNQLV